MEHISGDRLGV